MPESPDAEPDPYEVARTIVLRRLDVAPRTRSELRIALARKHVPDNTAEAVLDRMQEVGLIDDVAYARDWVNSRQSGRGLARRALSQELHRKGIGAEVARLALDQIDADDERARAEELVAKKLRSQDVPADRALREKLTRRLVGMLARKGYHPGLALAVVRDALVAHGRSDDGSASVT